ncbi:transposase [Stutzerimonas frequens]|uniref:Transposase n=1 Tax=Stutzerimonas frequens TaxID=2968969 RepID=A0AA47HYV1_9GAMM|nr:transposase [Stutzerimonas frequens]WAE52621.1 transposase [Stutzerimonas frequens]
MAVVNDSYISPRRYKVDGIVAGRDGRQYVIANIHTKARQVVLLGPVGETYVYDSDEFRNLVAAGELRLVVCKQNAQGVEEIFEPRQLMENEAKALDERKQYIDIILKYIDNSTWAYIYEQIQKEYGGQRKIPARRTIERYWNIYKQAKSPSCLAPKFSQRGVHRALRLDPHIEDIILNVLEEKYCKSSAFSVQDIISTINGQCDKKSAELNVELGGVSRRTVCRFIDDLNIKNMKGRLTQKTFRLIMRNALQYFDVLEPYGRVELDSTVLDILIVDKFGNIIGSPTLYAMIDTATQTIVGIFLTIQPASQVGVLQTLQFAFSAKGEQFRQRHGCIHRWPAPADIRVLVMDNGADCHGPMVVKAARYLSMQLEYCIAGAPYQKPFVERFFGSLHTMLIKKLPGAKYSHDKREEHALENAQKTAKLTIDELNSTIIRWITDTYHIKPSDRLTNKFGHACAPTQALELLIQKHVIYPAPSVEELMDSCRHHLGVKLNVTREGLNYQCQQYQNEYISSLYKTNGKQKVDVYVNPLDCSSIHVFDSDTKTWVVVPNKNPHLPAMSFEQAQFYRRQSYKTDLEISRAEHVLNQQLIIEDAHSTKSKKGRINRNRKAERDIERAQAAITAAAQQPDADVPLVSPDPIQTVVKPHRRKK